MDHHPRVRECKTFSLCSRTEQNRRHAGRLTHAVGLHIAGDDFHAVQNRKSGRDDSSRTVDVKINILLRIFRLKIEQLRDNQIGHNIINRRAEKDDPVFQKTGVDIISALSLAGLFDHHGHKH